MWSGTSQLMFVFSQISIIKTCSQHRLNNAPLHFLSSFLPGPHTNRLLCCLVSLHSDQKDVSRMYFLSHHYGDPPPPDSPTSVPPVVYSERTAKTPVHCVGCINIKVIPHEKREILRYEEINRIPSPSYRTIGN